VLPLQVLVTRTASPDGVRLTGEIDASNVHLVKDALSEFGARGGCLHVDLSELLFCDVSGIRALVSYAESLDRDRRLVLHGLPAQIEKVMNAVGWSELAGLEFCGCELGT
jgi:anti-anti-sigma factor